MTTKYKNLVLEKIEESTTITDKVLSKKLTSDGYVISEGFFNQILLDLEIMGLITVSWITKDTRRIEIVSNQEEEDEIEESFQAIEENAMEIFSSEKIKDQIISSLTERLSEKKGEEEDPNLAPIFDQLAQLLRNSLVKHQFN